MKCPQCSANLTPGSGEYIICQYCGSSLLWKPQAAQSVSQSTPEAAQQATLQGVRAQPEAKVSRGMRLKQFTYVDRKGTGLEMFRMLAPDGWQIRGGCRWLLDNPSMPAAISIQLYNPQGMEAFEILPRANTSSPKIPTLTPTSVPICIGKRCRNRDKIHSATILAWISFSRARQRRPRKRATPSE